MDRGIHQFHWQVCALDDTDLDRSATLGNPLGRPFLQSHSGTQGIGQVGLQDDAGLQVSEFRTLEDSLEDRDGQVEILVLLHVEVDELLRAGGGRAFEKRLQMVHDVVDGIVEGPVVVRCHGRRHLDRDVVNVVALQQPKSTAEPVLGLRRRRESPRRAD